jgi:hypothetical protein
MAIRIQNTQVFQMERVAAADKAAVMEPAKEAALAQVPVAERVQVMAVVTATEMVTEKAMVMELHLHRKPHRQSLLGSSQNRERYIPTKLGRKMFRERLF